MYEYAGLFQVSSPERSVGLRVHALQQLDSGLSVSTPLRQGHITFHITQAASHALCAAASVAL